MNIDVIVDNRSNYSFDLPVNEDTGYQYVRVRPNSVQEIMLQFTASSLGLANHSCKSEYNTGLTPLGLSYGA